MPGYHKIIHEATGYTEPAELERIEDTMRNVIFHSTLDWQSRAELHEGARDAVDVLVALDQIPEIDAHGVRITRRKTGLVEHITTECCYDEAGCSAGAGAGPLLPIGA